MRYWTAPGSGSQDKTAALPKVSTCNRAGGAGGRGALGPASDPAGVGAALGPGAAPREAFFAPEISPPPASTPCRASGTVGRRLRSADTAPPEAFNAEAAVEIDCAVFWVPSMTMVPST